MFELDPFARTLWRPYAALDVEVEEGSGHGPRWTAQVGIWLPPVRGRPFRLALEVMDGPSALGQFTRREVRRLGLGLFWNP